MTGSTKQGLDRGRYKILSDLGLCWKKFLTLNEITLEKMSR
jgi:hypothetical protein